MHLYSKVAITNKIICLLEGALDPDRLLGNIKFTKYICIIYFTCILYIKKMQDDVWFEFIDFIQDILIYIYTC